MLSAKTKQRVFVFEILKKVTYKIIHISEPLLKKNRKHNLKFLLFVTLILVLQVTMVFVSLVC